MTLINQIISHYKIVAQVGEGGRARFIARAIPNSVVTSRSRSCQRATNRTRGFGDSAHVIAHTPVLFRSLRRRLHERSCGRPHRFGERCGDYVDAQSLMLQGDQPVLEYFAGNC